MTDYSELVKALRRCAEPGTIIDECDTTDDCPYSFDGYCGDCMNNLVKDAAAAIEELLSFAQYVADKVTMSDEDWEDYHEAFTEVACRKLVKLGVISIEDDMYVYRQDEPQEVQE